ncbi:MAG: DJ-1/PfpI family protein [Paenalcaligenes sp.]
MKNIALVTFDQFTDIDLFLMWDILGRNKQDWNVRILATSPTVTSAHGLPIPVHGHVSQANHADAVLFASGKQGIPAALVNPEFMSSLQLDSSRQYIGSICAGAFILHRLGLLPHLQATTHPEAQMALQATGVEVLEQPLVCQDRVATAGGCLAAVYLVGWLVESMFGAVKRQETLWPVLPAGQQALYEQLITQSINGATSKAGVGQSGL